MDVVRWSNTQDARRAYQRADSLAARGPLEAFFEVAARCNLHCQMCAINYDARYLPGSRRPSVFAPDLFARLRPAFPSLLRAYLFGLGEPLLNPHLVDYIQELATAGVEVAFNTNATLIDERKADAIAMAGASRVTVSIDGATPATYERIRTGGSFEAVLRGIRCLRQAQKRYGRPSVSLSIVAMASNVAELPRLVDLCADVGASGVHIEPLLAQGQADLDQHYAGENLGTLDPALVARSLEETRRRAECREVRVSSRLFEAQSAYEYVAQARAMPIDWVCTEPWSSIWVTAAGEVRTCCLNETSFGNLFERKFAEIWNGPEFRAFRRQHAARELATGCGTCVRNGRVRHSAFFASVDPVTYRPWRLAPSAEPAPVRMDFPSPGSTVTDPIVVTGRIASGADGDVWEVMLEDTVLGVIRPNFALRPDGDFVLDGPIPYVTEGVHRLWIRRQRDDSASHADREVHVWRPDRATGRIKTTEALSLRQHSRRRIRRISASVDGRRWSAARFLSVDGGDPNCRTVLLDLRHLEPGEHSVQIRVNGWPSRPILIERLPGV